MLEHMSSDNVFEYKKLSSEEQKRRGILGRLVGVIADSVNATRNGRKYSAKLWQKVFEDPIMKEKIENRVCFGEACHPVDGREEVDPEKVAICLAEVPKMNTNGQLIGVFDILDTPCGRILKTMLDYGANIGVSSRGSGDVELDFNGEEYVNPDSYDCICWDAVFVPAVKEARLQYVTESLNSKPFTQALQESLGNASEHDKKIMREVMHDILKSSDTRLVEKYNNMAVDNNKADINKLQSIIKENVQLANTITKLQEKLSVSYAKEMELQKEVNKYSAVRSKLSTANSKLQVLQNKCDSLVEKLHKMKQELDKSNSNISILEKKNKSLRESIIHNESMIQELNESKKSSVDNETQLNESLQTMKVESELKAKEYATKIANSNKLVEQYKSMANTAADKYMNLQAQMLGVEVDEIKNKLSESYTFDDIDNVCEGLRSYKLTMNKLPFNSGKSLNENVHITANSVKPSIIPDNGMDDEIDEQLMNLAGI